MVVLVEGRLNRPLFKAGVEDDHDFISAHSGLHLLWTRRPRSLRGRRALRLSAGCHRRGDRAERQCRLSARATRDEIIARTGVPRLYAARRFRQAHLEIGRASCRERGCQYGEIVGGAVSLKKKKGRRNKKTE